MEETPTPPSTPGSLEDAVRQAGAASTESSEQANNTLPNQPESLTTAEVSDGVEQEPVSDVEQLSDGSSEYEDEEGDGLTEEPEINLSWQASEYIHHQKRPLWYVILFMAVALLLVAGILTHQWSGLVVLAAMTAAVVVYSNKPPRTLNYSLTNDGIVIESKFYEYAQFKSFAVISDVAWHSIDLDPVKRFAPRLTILFGDDDLDSIVEALSKELPRVDRQPDVIERATRFLKF